MQRQLAKRIVADPAILGGKPVLAGTRISVEHVLAQLGRGATVEDVTREYGLARDDVLAALRFAAAQIAHDTVLPATG
jgi:uncharacterized protein (DUF433 family)